MSPRGGASAPTSREAEPFDRAIADVTVWDTAHANSGLVVDFIAGEQVTLTAAGGLHDRGAVAHRLTVLIAAGVRHIRLDLHQVSEIEPAMVGCLKDIALHLDDSGGRLEFFDVQPVVSTAFASFDFGGQFDRTDHDRHVAAERPRRHRCSDGGTNR